MVFPDYPSDVDDEDVELETFDAEARAKRTRLPSPPSSRPPVPPISRHRKTEFVPDDEPDYGEGDLRKRWPLPFDGKVRFRESDHAYAFFVDGVAYSDHIVSGSSLYDLSEDDLRKEIPKKKDFKISYSTRTGVAERFRNNVATYFDGVAKKAFPLPRDTFERYSIFDAPNPGKLTTMLMPTNTFEAVEEWILSGFAKELADDHRVTFARSGGEYAVSRFPKLAHARPKVLNATKNPFDADDVQTKYDEWRDGGTRLHAYLEARLNGLSHPETLARGVSADERCDYDQAESFLSKNNHLFFVPTRTELRMGDEDTMICGSMDFCYYDPRKKTWFVGDFKRSKNVVQYVNGRFVENGSKKKEYLDQLTTYRELLKRSLERCDLKALSEDWGFEVTADVSRDVFLHVFHPTLPDHYRLAMYVDDEVERKIRNKMAARSEFVASTRVF